ncbi:exonuclease/endonuclease/phosphatase family protein [Actinomadura harenae]|uniref:hypothetical protein n=1 Tax=Actinomadura harenae TaxID=2483351 RepID=UPI0011C38917|nr:hypothetical protein [Actinomadura harenae]
MDTDLVLLQEVPELASDAVREKAETDLGMRIAVSPTGFTEGCLNAAIAWRQSLTVEGIDVRYSRKLHHGYIGAHIGLDRDDGVPLTVISTHLDPTSATSAAQEAQQLVQRVWRTGGIGLIAGDINHMPLGDPEPPWEQIHPHNRASRCLPRASPGDEWRGNRIVGQVLMGGDLTDVAAHAAERASTPQERDELLQMTGTHGRIRVDQIHATPALVPAISGYRVISTDASDHRGIVWDLDLDLVEVGALREFH